MNFKFPTFITLAEDGLYQKADSSGGGSGYTFFCTGVKACLPLTFVPKILGSWMLYAGVNYYHLHNQRLRDGNRVLTPNEHRKVLVQFHGGVSIFSKPQIVKPQRQT